MLALILATVISGYLPIPHRYQNNTTVVLHEMTQAEINSHCGMPENSNLNTWACGEYPPNNNIYMPNPCKYPEANNPFTYAHLLCHEIAHTEGWHHKE